jgi:hypothetical protein
MTCYALNEEKMFADITDGIAIVINSETGIYYGMDELGTAVFEQLIKGVSQEKVLAALQSLPNAPADTAVKLENFITDLREKGLIISGDEYSTEVSFTTPEEFSLTLSEYSDAQELLMADPIHEIKEDTGWTPEKDSIGYTKEETKEREKKMEI